MANPFRQALGGTQPLQRGRRNLATALLQHIQNFQGNPVQMIQEKLNSGEMTQEQYNQLHGIAEGIAQQMMGILRR